MNDPPDNPAASPPVAVRHYDYQQGSLAAAQQLPREARRLRILVAVIPPSAFCHRCDRRRFSFLQRVELSPAVQVIEESTFAYCVGLTELVFHRQQQQQQQQDDDDEASATNFSHQPWQLRSIAFGAFLSCEALEALIVPPDCPLKIIGKDAFWGCKALKTVVLPSSSIQFIHNNAFAWCSSLNDVTFVPNGAKPSPLQHLGAAFFRCSSLKTIDLSSLVHLKLIEALTFYECRALTSVQLPPHLQVIQRKAFCNCTSLRAVDLPASVRRIGDGCFQGCRDLRYLRMHGPPTELGSTCFHGCTALTAVECWSLPALTAVATSGALADCTALTTLVLPPIVPVALWPFWLVQFLSNEQQFVRNQRQRVTIVFRLLNQTPTLQQLLDL